MANPNLSRTLQQAIYSFTRRLGVPGTIYRRLSGSVDYLTGEQTDQVESRSIRNVAILPTQLAREVNYTPSMMNALRAFAWQGGAGQDSQHTTMAILKTDLRDWGEVEPSQWMTIEGDTYEVADIMAMPGGWIIAAKQTKGVDSGVQVDVSQDAGISGEATE